MTDRTMTNLTSTRSGLRARWFNRRRFMMAAAAAGAALTLPGRADARPTANGRLSLLVRQDLLPVSIVNDFARQTGIEVRLTQVANDEELLFKLRASDGRGFDLLSAEAHRAEEWLSRDLLASLKSDLLPVDSIAPSLLTRISGFSSRGETRFAPILVTREGLVWNADLWQPNHPDGGAPSYGDLWVPGSEGRIMGQPLTLLVGIGLFLDRIGEVPSNRLLDTFQDEGSMRGLFQKIVDYGLEHRDAVRQFWAGSEDQQNALLQNGVVLGQGWDGPANRMAAGGNPIRFEAPREGALGSLAGLALSTRAENIAEAEAFIRHLYQPDVNIRLSEQTGYQSVMEGQGKTTGDLWVWPPVPSWYARELAGFRDRFLAG